MLDTIGLVIAWLGALGIMGIGVAYLVKSEAVAAGFGLPATPEPEARGWWQVKGIRDVATGLLGIVFIFAAREQLPLLLLLLAVIPLGDMCIVLSNRGSRMAAFTIHGATAAALVLSAGLLVA